MAQLGRDILLQISTVFFKWQDTDKASLLCLLAVFELLLHWTWLGATYLNREAVREFVVIEHLIPAWLGCSLVIAILLLLTFRFKKIKDSPKKFYSCQVFMVVIYMMYIDIAIVLIEQELLLSGASFMGSTIIGLLLIDRRIVWWAFVAQCCYIFIFTLASHHTLSLPSLRQIPEYFDLVSHETDLLREGVYDFLYIDGKGRLYQKSIVDASHLYWRISYMYLLLPKAIVIVFMVKLLLELIDEGHEAVRHRATHDELTGLKNKARVFDALREQAFHADNQDDLSVVIIDLDYFKAINDKYGHGVGDIVLQKTASLFKQHLPPATLLGRYGGEEFLLILPNCVQSKAVDIANELRNELCDSVFAIEGNKIQLSASFGVASICHNCLGKMQQMSNDDHEPRQAGSTQSSKKLSNKNDILLKQLIKNADAALYQAKYYGRNRVMWGARMDCLDTALKNTVLKESS